MKNEDSVEVRILHYDSAGVEFISCAVSSNGAGRSAARRSLEKAGHYVASISEI